MKPIFQDQFIALPEQTRGNCFAACLASILEIPLSEVPSYERGDGWIGCINTWLEPRGLALLCWDVQHYRTFRPPGYAILSVSTSHPDFDHALIARDGVIVHDPDPHTAASVTEDQYRWWFTFVALNPAHTNSGLQVIDMQHQQ